MTRCLHMTRVAPLRIHDLIALTIYRRASSGTMRFGLLRMLKMLAPEASIYKVFDSAKARVSRALPNSL